MRIEPTVGRVVWYHPGEGHPDYGETLAAMIARINPDGTINIGFLSTNGLHDSRRNVRLVQAGEQVPLSHYCEWPYQINHEVMPQAARATNAFVFIPTVHRAGFCEGDLCYLRLRSDDGSTAVRDFPFPYPRYPVRVDWVSASGGTVEVIDCHGKMHLFVSVVQRDDPAPMDAHAWVMLGEPIVTDDFIQWWPNDVERLIKSLQSCSHADVGQQP